MHMRYEDVAHILQSFSRAGQQVRLVVAHSEQEEPEEEEVIPEVMDVSGSSCQFCMLFCACLCSGTSTHLQL